LTGDQTSIKGFLKILMEVVENFALLEDLFGGIYLMQHITWIPW